MIFGSINLIWNCFACAKYSGLKIWDRKIWFLRWKKKQKRNSTKKKNQKRKTTPQNPQAARNASTRHLSAPEPDKPMASLLSIECDKRLSTSLSMDFWRTLKQEDIYIRGYETVTECRQGLKEYFVRHNDVRLHSSLDWNTPSDVYFKRVHLDNVA